MERSWYYAEAGQQAGPVPEQDLQSMIRNGRLPPDVMVWTEGYAQWVPASWVFKEAYVDPFRGYAGFWKRFAAFFIDSIIINTVIFFAAVVFGILYGLVFQTAKGVEVLGGLLGFAIYWLYFALFESSQAQATPGKMLLGIKVTDANENRVSFARASGRFFAKFISSMFLCAGYVITAFTQKKQALHDILADCLVMEKR